MSQVKKLREMGIEFEDPSMWKLLEDLDNLPQYLEQKRLKRIERAKFVDSVWRSAIEMKEKLERESELQNSKQK